MEELFFRIVERVGFPIAVSVLSFWCVFKLFQMREKERDSRNDSLTKATVANTAVIEKLNDTMLKNMGSDPDGKICRYREIMAAMAEEKIILKANEAAILLKKRAEEAEARLAEQAEFLARKIPKETDTAIPAFNP